MWIRALMGYPFVNIMGYPFALGYPFVPQCFGLPFSFGLPLLWLFSAPFIHKLFIDPLLYAPFGLIFNNGLPRAIVFLASPRRNLSQEKHF